VRALLLVVLSVTPVAAKAPPAPKELTATDLDRMLAREWKKAHLSPAPAVDDARFLRRLYLDLAGVIPPAEVVDSFLDDKAKDKRARAIDALLDSPSFSEHFAAYWDKVLLGKFAPPKQIDRAAFRGWLKAQLEKNAGWDEIARGLVTASGVNNKEGATNFVLRWLEQPPDLAGRVSRVFLGVQIQCAQCHDHKSEKWKQEDFNRFAAFFVKTGAKPLDDGKAPGVRPIRVEDFPIAVAGLKKNEMQMKSMVEAMPRTLDGTEAGAGNRRQALATWMTRPDNPWFARAFVNRTWAGLLGRGFVEPIDDFRRSNPTVAPEILDAVADDFRAHKYDVRRLVRLIVSTRAYQLAAAPSKNPDAEKLWARYRLRMLGPDELLDSVAAATKIETLMQKTAGDKFEQKKQQLRAGVSFLFDVDEEQEQTDYDGTVAQALMMMNGLLVNSGASALPGATLADVLAMPVSDDKKVEALYLRTLSRRPSAAELARWHDFIDGRQELVKTAPPPKLPKPDGKTKQKPDPLARMARKWKPGESTPQSQAYEDVFWALLNSSEFTFRH
jgi:hypothetical protein